MPRGRRTHGADIGVILLDTDLPRPVGDIGNARTFNFPIHYQSALGALPTTVVEHKAFGLIDTFVTAGRELLERGARALSTSCGFLAIYQEAMVETLRVPVATSSLLQISTVLRMLPTDQKIGLLTANGSALGEAHFGGVGLTADEVDRLHIIGLEHTEHFYPVVVEGVGALDVPRAMSEVVSACVEALEHAPTIGAFVFECVNLPPYSRSVREATGLPVWDAFTLVNWLQQGIS